MTLDELRSLRELAIRLNRINEEIDRLRSFVTKVTSSFDGMPHSGQQHDAMAEYVAEAEVWIDRRIETAGKIMEEVMSLSDEISELTRPQATVIFGYYAEGKSIRRMARDLHYSERNIYKLLKRGERRLTKQP